MIMHDASVIGLADKLDDEMRLLSDLNNENNDTDSINKAMILFAAYSTLINQGAVPEKK